MPPGYKSAVSETTIFHNPNCGTSRNVLQALRDAGREPMVVEYLKAGWTEDQLRNLFRRMGVSAREALRVRGTQAEALGLLDADEATIIGAMARDPALVERPIVVTDKGAALCRPKEKVQDLL